MDIRFYLLCGAAENLSNFSCIIRVATCKLYKVWLEDNTSLEKRLKLVDDNKLAGAAFWKLGFENSSVWDTVIKYLN